jgi:hypothetical protein
LSTNKNQHFVPRCHLKPFTLDGQGLAINLYNLNRQQLIRNAPVKHQCSRDYFYGRHQELENAIQALEGDYANVIRRLVARSNHIEEQDAKFLSSFWIFQHVRTEALQQSIVKQGVELQQVVGQELPEFAFDRTEATLLALDAFAHNSEAIADLSVVLVKNGTTTAFLTSDNPAVQTNRWALHNSARRVATFGMHSAGALALLPITPKLLVMLYDKDIYSVSHVDRLVIARNAADVRALNEHQQLNCVANLYVAPSFTEEQIAQLPDLTKERAASGPRIHVFQKKDNADQKYYATPVFDRTKGTEAIFATPTYFASPNGWPSFLNWRSKGFYFANGSGVGQVRRAWIRREPDTKPFEKLYTGR